MVPRRSLMVGCCPWVAIDPDTEGLSAQMKSSERRRVSLRRFGRSSFLPEARPPATMAPGGRRSELPSAPGETAKAWPGLFSRTPSWRLAHIGAVEQIFGAVGQVRQLGCGD